MQHRHSHADRRRYHYLYKVTCKVTGRYYIGMHSTDDMEDGYMGSGIRLWKSFKKHGLEQHVKEVLEHLPSREALRLREEQVVSKELIADPLCMNLALGGGLGWEQVNAARTPEQWLALQKAGYKAGIQSMSFEQRSARTKTLREARKQRDPEALAKHETTLAAAGCAAAASEEANAKRISTMKANGHSQGEKNPMFGMKWITDGVKPKRVPKESVTAYLLQGWREGRK